MQNSHFCQKVNLSNLHYVHYVHYLHAAAPADHQLDLAAARPLLGRGGGGERAAGRPRVPPRQQRRAGARGAGEPANQDTAAGHVTTVLTSDWLQVVELAVPGRRLGFQDKVSLHATFNGVILLVAMVNVCVHAWNVNLLLPRWAFVL